MDDPYKSPASMPQPEFVDPADQVLASRSDRFVGALIDGIIMTVALGVSAVILVPLFSEQDLLQAIESGSVSVSIGLTVISVLLFLAINGKWLYSSGQTVGKKLVDTQVVNEDGSVISGNDYFVKRYLIMVLITMLPILGFFIGILNPLLIFRQNHKCLHDDIAKTKVIKLGVSRAED